MIVLPWPGVRACPAPSAIAVRNERMITRGVRSDAPSRPEISPATPPGTAAGAATDAMGAAEATGAELATGLADVASGEASGADQGSRVAPPGSAVNATWLTDSGCDSRSDG